MTIVKTFGLTIQDFLAAGMPTGLRKATISVWPGLTLAAPAATSVSLSALTNADCTRTYALHSRNPQHSGEMRECKGQTEWKAKAPQQNCPNWRKVEIFNLEAGHE